LSDRPARTVLAPGLEISRIVTGLWQVADQERTGTLDLDAAANDMVAYRDAGFDTFDMADHYGSAELIAGRARRRLLERQAAADIRIFTKWCPPPDQHEPAQVRAGIQQRLDRLGVETIDLLQLHWWSYPHSGYLDVMDELVRLREAGKIRHIGLTNFDADHLHLLLEEGYPIASNQVSASLLDRRFLGPMSQLCAERGIRLLTFGTLAGGFLSERWIGQPAPDRITDWSKLKYHRFIDAAGGWPAFQGLLAVLAGIAERRAVSIANVAARWVLDAPSVAAIIVGARLTENAHRTANAKLFDLTLTGDDGAEIDRALTRLKPIPGDCGDEYRRPPFLTASGDLSDHLDALPAVFATRSIGARTVASSGSVWESAAGFGRAMRAGNRILVSGSTATHGRDRIVCRGDVRGQTVYTLDKIIGAISSLGGRREDVVRTRILMRDASRWAAAASVHGNYFGDVLPANTLVEIAGLVGDYEIEIEAEAVVGDG